MIEIVKGIGKPYEKRLKVTSFLFPAGEVGIKIPDQDFAFEQVSDDTTIIARIHDSNDFFRLALVTDAFRRSYSGDVNLFLPYVPYARQDRQCVAGESFSLKVFAGLINSLEFSKVTIVDPHSDVTPAVLNNCRVIRQQDVINAYLDFINRVLKGATFCSPDAGANKKTSELAKYFNHSSFIRADKLRNLATGEIKETIVYADDFQGQDVVIADDICDGGRTFTELSKVLKAKNAGKVILYVTHGIFTKGTGVLFENGIDEIYTTNSYYDVWPAGISDKIVTLNLEQTLSR